MIPYVNLEAIDVKCTILILAEGFLTVLYYITIMKWFTAKSQIR